MIKVIYTMDYSFRHGVIFLLSMCLFSCENLPEINTSVTDVDTPTNWQNKPAVMSVENNWLRQFNNVQLQTLVEDALSANHQLQVQAYQLDMSEQNIIISGSQLWPQLDLSMQSSRRKNKEPTSYSNSNTLSLDLRYEVDIWGKLSAADRQNQYNYLAEQALFEQAKQRLVVNVVTTWLSVVEANQLLTLFEKQAKNARDNLIIIEAGYDAGLNEALDVYLIRNELNNALTQLSAQQLQKVSRVRALERLLGKYPSGELIVDSSLPNISKNIPLGLPSELISRKPQLKSSWYQLLAKDAALAFAHKQRFPSVNLSSSINNTTGEISDLLSSSSLAWSLLGGISAPIFNAGRLEANETKARLALKQSEQLYLDTLYSAFNDVENAISTEQSLQERYQTILEAQNNAILAAQLSFEQYQTGLIIYTAVLDSQNRSFTAQANLIRIQNQLIVNRINLHFSLGGSFTEITEPTSQVIANASGNNNDK